MLKQATKKQAIEAATEYVRQIGVLALVDSLNSETSEALPLVAGISKIHSGMNTLTDVIAFATQHTITGSEAHKSWLGLRDRVRSAKRAEKSHSGAAGHYEKRKIISSLLLRTKPRSIGDFIKDQPVNDETTSFDRPRIVYRARTKPTVKRGQALSDTDDYSGYYIVAPDESVIFLCPDDNHVELAVLRGVARSTELYKWLEDVIHTACDERRDVRPYHPGKMVQVGWNTGPRHARFFGLAKSYTKNLDTETAVDHDQDAIAALALTWSVAKAFLPQEMIERVNAAVGETGLPKMATRNVPEGTGYRLTLGGKTYDFPLHDRSPCEGLFTENYAAPGHYDPSHAPYTFSWSIVHEADTVSQCPLIPPNLDRSRRSQQPNTAENPRFLPAQGGGNFVDLSLKVKVRQSAGTLLAHCPEFLHGTTLLGGTRACGITIPFTLRIQKEFEKMKQKGTHVVERNSV